MKRKIKKMSLFAAACGIVAFAYLLYRIAAVSFPVAVMGNHYMSPKPTLPACLAENESHNNIDKAPIISSEYQQFIKSKKHESANLVRNPGLQSQRGGAIPTGYEPNIEDESITYSRQLDTDGSAYLQVANNQHKAASAEVQPGWTIDPIDIEKGQTYAYGFMYRAKVPVQVQLELRTGTSLAYQNITELLPSEQWKEFTAHYQSAEGVDSMRIILSIREAGDLDVKGYSLYKIEPSKLNQRGIVTITFDDGWQSFYTKALPLLQADRMPTTQFIVSDFSSKKIAGYMNIDEVMKLKQAGNEIGSHSLQHCDQANMHQRDIAKDTVQSKKVLNQHSVGPVKSFAYPHGSYNAKTQQVIEPEYELIRTSDAGYNDRYFDRTNIRAMSVMSTTTNREFESWLRYAADNNVWLVLTYHRIDETGEYSNTTAQLKDQLDLIKKADLRVMTLSDAAKVVRNNN